ncbi:MAG: acetyl-CoA carboxylase carboxyltransferase subunit beta [Deltaproteobacteria bacterium]|nr:acetyl-CoA carboxylase carboxyltransferase subunit beta [Deltaproteobacteria bacterium]
MSAWFSRVRAPKPSIEEADRIQLPGGLWTKCQGCSEIAYSREIERNLMICPKCDYHFRLTSKQRIRWLCDRQSFEEMDADLKTNDPLNFKDVLRYKDRLKRAQKSSGVEEAVRIGRARIDGHEIMLGLFDFSFMGGSMGMVVGEKLTRMIEVAIRERKPVIILSSSGGARMQEGLYSLMQMAKISAALSRLSQEGLPYISVLSDPTTGGVAASFAMQGDIIIAEPRALIGFAGPRVIEQTIRKKLPEGFQRSEFLLEHGMLDLIVSRKEMKATLANLLEFLTPR